MDAVLHKLHSLHFAPRQWARPNAVSLYPAPPLLDHSRLPRRLCMVHLCLVMQSLLGFDLGDWDFRESIDRHLSPHCAENSGLARTHPRLSRPVLRFRRPALGGSSSTGPAEK